MHNFTLPESAKVIGLLDPATDAAGRTGRYVNMTLAPKAYFVFHVTQGNAATIALDLVQATAAAGTGVKVLTGVRRIWTNLDLATNDTFTRQTAALLFTTDAAVKNKMIILELNANDLDLPNGFCYVAPRTGASNVANLTQAYVHIVPAYPGASQPSYTA